MDKKKHFKSSPKQRNVQMVNAAPFAARHLTVVPIDAGGAGGAGAVDDDGGVLQ